MPVTPLVFDAGENHTVIVPCRASCQFPGVGILFQRSLHDGQITLCRFVLPASLLAGCPYMVTHTAPVLAYRATKCITLAGFRTHRSGLGFEQQMLLEEAFLSPEAKNRNGWHPIWSRIQMHTFGMVNECISTTNLENCVRCREDFHALQRVWQNYESRC